MTKNEKDTALSVYSDNIKKTFAEFKSQNRRNNVNELDLVKCVKKNIFGDAGKGSKDLNVLIASLKKILEIGKVTPADYDRFFSTKINRALCVEHLLRDIIDLASDEVKEECAFQKKRMIFKMAFPEYYKHNFEKIAPHDILFTSGENKAAIVRAAKPVSISSDGEVHTPNGAIVDRIISKAIIESFQESGIDDYVEMMKILADPHCEQVLASQFGSTKSSIPGAFAAINERKCYSCYLDFFFLNLPAEDQLFLVDDFMDIRNDPANKIPENELITAIYDIFEAKRDSLIDMFYQNQENNKVSSKFEKIAAVKKEIERILGNVPLSLSHRAEEYIQTESFMKSLGSHIVSHSPADIARFLVETDSSSFAYKEMKDFILDSPVKEEDYMLG